MWITSGHVIKLRTDREPVMTKPSQPHTLTGIMYDVTSPYNAVLIVWIGARATWSNVKIGLKAILCLHLTITLSLGMAIYGSLLQINAMYPRVLHRCI